MEKEDSYGSRDGSKVKYSSMRSLFIELPSRVSKPCIGIHKVKCVSPFFFFFLVFFIFFQFCQKSRDEDGNSGKKKVIIIIKGI